METERASSAAPPSPTSTPVPTPAPLPTAASTPSAASFAWRRFLRLDLGGGEIRLALTRPQAALAGVGLIVLLMAAFFVGRYSGNALPAKTVAVEDILSASPTSEPPPTATAAPVPGRGRGASPIVTPLAQPVQEPSVAKPPPAPTATEPPGESVLAHDSFYVVVQHFRLRDRERADAAQEFLRSRGIECTIQTGADLQLVATEPFASEQQAESLRKRIVDIGKEYRESGGGYDFASAKARKF
jgi:cell division septation protein DedD